MDRRTMLAIVLFVGVWMAYFVARPLIWPPEPLPEDTAALDSDAVTDAGSDVGTDSDTATATVTITPTAVPRGAPPLATQQRRIRPAKHRTPTIQHKTPLKLKSG